MGQQFFHEEYTYKISNPEHAPFRSFKKGDLQTHPLTHAQTDRQAENNMPFQLFQNWGHKKQLNTLCLSYIT